MINPGTYLTRGCQVVEIDEAMIDQIDLVASGAGVEVELGCFNEETNAAVTTTLSEGEIAVRRRVNREITILKALSEAR